MSPAKKIPDSFDAYWAEVTGARTETIRGVTVRVPVDVPMVLGQRIVDLQESEQEEDMAELIGLLFGVGADAFETWKQAGMGVEEFQVVLAWGLAHANGNPITWQDAHRLAQDATSGKVPAPPNRAARRASSASTGGPSKPRSSRSTASTRRASRA